MTIPQTLTSPKTKLRAGLSLLLLLGLYAVTVSFIGINGDFPLNDDWAFGSTAKIFATTGEFKPSSWSAIPLIFEVLVATPVCLLSKCGFDDLRLVTLIASGTFILGTFVLLIMAGLSITIALMATALVAFNPIAYTLSFTFMSDILFAALMTLSVVLFALSFRGNLLTYAAIATILAISATLTRQLGLCIPIAFLVVRLVQTLKQRDWRPSVALYAVPLLACGLALVLLRYWLEASGKVPALYDAKNSEIAKTLQSPLTTLKRIGHNLSVVILYLGLFSLPVTLVSRDPLFETSNTWAQRLPSTIALALVALCIADLFALGRLFPMGGNILAAQGIGPLLLRDVGFLGIRNLPPLPQPFWLGVTALSILGAYLMLRRLVVQTRIVLQRIWQTSCANQTFVWLFVALAASAYIVPLLLIPFYDRYLIPIFPMVLYLLCANSVKMHLGVWRTAVAVTFCVFTALFSVLAVHDYMAWNRARWAALSMLENSRRVDPSMIDGGFEYNGLRSYDPKYVTQEGKSWWWIKRDDYQIAFGPIDGMVVDQRFEYKTLLPPATRAIVVLRRPTM